MKTVMSIIAGLVIGYFAYQYFISNSKGKLNGRLHKSVRDKKLAGVCGGVIVQWRFVLVGRMNHLLEKKCW